MRIVTSTFWGAPVNAETPKTLRSSIRNSILYLQLVLPGRLEMFAGVLEVLLNRFRPPRPGPVSTPPGGERAG
jgi:hypothetical protein